MDIMENIRVCEEHRRRKYKKENYFQLSGIYLTFNHRATQRFGFSKPGSILRQFCQTPFLLIKRSLRWMTIPFERKEAKQNKKIFLFLTFQTQVIHKQLFRCYWIIFTFPLPFLAPPQQYSKKYPNPSLHALSDLIWNLCVPRTYIQGKTTISDMYNHYRN